MDAALLSKYISDLDAKLKIIFKNPLFMTGNAKIWKYLSALLFNIYDFQ